MATVSPGSESDIDLTYGMRQRNLSGDAAIAGEQLPAGRLAYIETGASGTAGRIYLCQPNDGTATPSADHRGRVIGVTPRLVEAGQPTTLFGPGTRVYYGGGNLSEGARYYVGEDGQVDDAATLNDQEGVAVGLNADEYLLLRALPTT